MPVLIPDEVGRVDRRILEAVRERDGAKARNLMKAHLAHMRQYIILGAFDEAAADGRTSP